MLITLECTAPPRSLDESPANVQKQGPALEEVGLETKLHQSDLF
jgi:hypothetical protein